MKPTIAFVTGGYSGEAVISYKSAVTIEQNLDTQKYDVYKIDITPKSWYHQLPDGQRVEIDRNDFSLKIEGDRIRFDAVFIGIHGTPGEDGKLQGYFDLMNLPYTSCDAATSALTFNKRYTVAVAAFAGIHVARSLHLFKHRPLLVEEILGQLKLPLFVKPANGGSSIGMSKVNKQDELAPALQKAFREDEQVLVEEFISGREFTIGVFKTKDKVVALPFTEIKTKKEFFDFEAKYKGLSEEITPAILDELVANDIRLAAKKAYEILNCRGIVRIDFIVNEANKKPYMLEVNTVPGQSEASIIPLQVKAMGWTLKDFYTAVIEEAFNY